MIINRIYENQNFLSLWLVSFLAGVRTYQHSFCIWLNVGFNSGNTPCRVFWHFKRNILIRVATAHFYHRALHNGVAMSNVLFFRCHHGPNRGSTNITQNLLHNVASKGKAVPLQAWSDPEVSRKLRFPDFMTTTQDGGKIFSLAHWAPLPQGNTPGTHFC
jgi:hypothetical protein